MRSDWLPPQLYSTFQFERDVEITEALPKHLGDISGERYRSSVVIAWCIACRIQMEKQNTVCFSIIRSYHVYFHLREVTYEI